MARRHITIVVELDTNGNPVEINRAWMEEEVALPTGGIGMMPKVNVDEISLAGLLPDLAEVTSQLVATQEALADKTVSQVEKDDRISELEARITELTAVPDRVIHKAYLRAALASIDKLAEVDAAVTAAGVVQWELWANATTISQDDPEVNAIAEALDIDLAAVFEIAHGIRSARENK